MFTSAELAFSPFWKISIILVHKLAISLKSNRLDWLFVIIQLATVFNLKILIINILYNLSWANFLNNKFKLIKLSVNVSLLTENTFGMVKSQWKLKIQEKKTGRKILDQLN